jgi:hypothetical protein
MAMTMASPDLAMGGGTCAPTTVPCTDQSIQELALYKKASTRVVENEADGAGWKSHIDATGGGLSPSESFVYAKFEDSGLVRVPVGDEDAFGSVGWDIAFRRYVARLNSGVSGPSCVMGATISSDYDSLTSAPDGLSYQPEAYYDDQCTQVMDSSGLGAPGTIMQDYWSYSGCVQMTGQVYVIKLASGRRVKLVVSSYYEPTAQATCDSTGTIPSGTVGGQVRVRWAFLDK